MFTCPKCRTELTKYMGEQGVFWECASCGGRTATVAFLRKMVPRQVVNAIWRTARSGEHEKKRRCPSCGRRMPEIPVLVDPEAVHIDVCPLCQFIWFDPAEYERLPALREKPQAEPTLSANAREKIAEIEIRKWDERYGDEFDSEVPEEWWKIILGMLGMPVEHETKSVFQIPYATWSVGAAILAISLIAFTDLRNVIDSLGLIPADLWRLGGLTLVTSFFLHAGWAHLLGNLYFLLVFGDNVEERLGAWRFLLLLLIATLVGDIAHILSDIGSWRPCIGASGGISGVLAYYAFAFPGARISLLFRFGYHFHWVQMPAAGLFFIWVLLQFLGAYLQMAGVSSVSALAHLGGAGAGVAFWFATRKS